MSLCTPEQIAEKRRIAQERLLSKNSGNSTSTKPSSALQLKQPPAAPNPATSDNDVSKFLRAFQYNQKPVEKSPNKPRFASHPYARISPKKAKTSLIQKINSTSQATLQDPTQYFPNRIQIVTCRLEMTSERRFAIHLSEFHSKVIDVCKTIPTKNYDPKSRTWSFDLNDYDLVVERVGSLRPYIELEGIPKKILSIFASKDELDDVKVSSYMASISDEIADHLLPFQKEGVAFGIKKQGRLLIADEMGLGKTYQALALADLYKEDWPLFIATTASTRDSWVTHVRKLMPRVNCHHIACVTSSSDFFDEAKVVICSYAIMEKCIEKLESMQFGVLIMDESHTLKNTKAKCTGVAEKLARKAKRIILLTGTPALSRPVELFSQLKMLDKNFLSYTDYTRRYCDAKQGPFGWDASGQSNLDELKIILSKKFMIRRLKADVLPQLAEKNRETVYLDEDLIKQHKAYRDLAKTMAKTLGSNIKLKEDLLVMYYAETAEIKCAAICFYLKSIIKQKIKFIVFAHHKVVMDAICDCLKDLKVSHIRIDGSTKNELRAQKVNRFQTKDTCRVAVLSLKACNAGISLTAAQLIIFAELDWNPSTLAQAESRAHRIGQEGNVTCRYLLARNTADDVIWKMLHEKQDVLNKVGLFSEDLRKSEHIVGPSTAGNINKYVVKTPRKNGDNSLSDGSSSNDNTPLKQIFMNDNVNKPEQSEQNSNKNASESFVDLLNDGEDDEFANINF